jgi:uncharacterized protein (DUF1778 family)
VARTEQVNTRLDPDELAAIAAAAAKRGLTVSEYLRVAAIEATQKACPKCGGSGRL